MWTPIAAGTRSGLRCIEGQVVDKCGGRGVLTPPASHSGSRDMEGHLGGGSSLHFVFPVFFELVVTVSFGGSGVGGLANPSPALFLLSEELVLVVLQ